LFGVSQCRGVGFDAKHVQEKHTLCCGVAVASDDAASEMMRGGFEFGRRVGAIPRPHYRFPILETTSCEV
jgi:hypothetical protein